ncbi:MAG: hypothetical protein AUK54_00030, partial [Helicobacteraceae bacterium CG2_30_36_10]
MASFKDKIKDKKTIGNRIVNSDEAIGLAFQDEKIAKLVTVKLTALCENPYQPRQSIDKDLIKGLAESISQNGLLQPIIISPIDNNPNKFHIVAGHRRVEATKLLDEEIINAIIVNMSNEELRINSLVENIQREDLTALEEAFAIKNLVDSGLKQIDLVEKLGKSKSIISQFIKISSLDAELINYIKIKSLNLGATLLYVLAGLPLHKQLKAIQHIDSKSLNREQIRDYVKKINGDI